MSSNLPSIAVAVQFIAALLLALAGLQALLTLDAPPVEHVESMGETKAENTNAGDAIYIEQPHRLSLRLAAWVVRVVLVAAAAVFFVLVRLPTLRPDSSHSLPAGPLDAEEDGRGRGHAGAAGAWLLRGSRHLEMDEQIFAHLCDSVSASAQSASGLSDWVPRALLGYNLEDSGVLELLHLPVDNYGGALFIHPPAFVLLLSTLSSGFNLPTGLWAYLAEILSSILGTDFCAGSETGSHRGSDDNADININSSGALVENSLFSLVSVPLPLSGVLLHLLAASLLPCLCRAILLQPSAGSYREKGAAVITQPQLVPWLAAIVFVTCPLAFFCSQKVLNQTTK
jgi:hypothetical protein